MTDEDLNRAIAEAIGLKVVQHGSAIFVWVDTRGWIAANFANDVTASLAIKERNGYDGPVVWLSEHRGDRRPDYPGQLWLHPWEYLNVDIEEWAYRGPRALAKAVLEALEAQKGA